MKKYTHAWLAFMAIKRLQQVKHSKKNQPHADSLVSWFMGHRDDVIQGAWYPDDIIKDMGSSHVLKIKPEADGPYSDLRPLPSTYCSLKARAQSPVFGAPYNVDQNTNLPDRCEAIGHSVIDHLKMLESEKKGSPVSPTDNQIALLMFMLSHYVADAHVPFHCDARSFSSAANIHGHVEGLWDREIKKCYHVDTENRRFLYDSAGYPLPVEDSQGAIDKPFLPELLQILDKRKFLINWGKNKAPKVENKNIWDFMLAVCQHSYLLSHNMIPSEETPKTVTKKNWDTLSASGLTYEELSVWVLSDAIDSIARVWLHIWRKYRKWEIKKTGGS